MSMTGYSAGPDSDSTLSVAIRVEWLIFRVPPVFGVPCAKVMPGSVDAAAIPIMTSRRVTMNAVILRLLL